MVTTISRKSESSAAANTVLVDRPTTSTAAPADISGVPETPAELLKQWDAPRRPLIHTVISATLVRVWDAITGPGMTDQERSNRTIAEHNGYMRAIGRKF